MSLTHVMTLLKIYAQEAMFCCCLFLNWICLKTMEIMFYTRVLNHERAPQKFYNKLYFCKILLIFKLNMFKTNVYIWCKILGVFKHITIYGLKTREIYFILNIYLYVIFYWI
jgi:hypothetical protein